MLYDAVRLYGTKLYITFYDIITTLYYTMLYLLGYNILYYRMLHYYIILLHCTTLCYDMRYDAILYYTTLA